MLNGGPGSSNNMVPKPLATVDLAYGHGHF